MNDILLQLINDAINWEKHLEDWEPSKYCFKDCQDLATQRIYKKYEKLLFTSFVDPQIISLFKKIKNLEL